MRISRPLYKCVSHAVTDNRLELNLEVFSTTFTFFFLIALQRKSYEPGAKSERRETQRFSTRTDQGSYILSHTWSWLQLSLQSWGLDNHSILSYFSAKHLDQLHVGILSRTNGSIVQVPHLTCLQDETQRQVEDFYNSHRGEQASERRCVP